jgi:hypothetical protein
MPVQVLTINRCKVTERRASRLHLHLVLAVPSNSRGLGCWMFQDRCPNAALADSLSCCASGL